MQSGGVLVVASAYEAGALDVALATGERVAAANRRMLAVLATFGIPRPLRAMIELGAATSLTDLDAESRAEAECQVRHSIGSISPHVGVRWRCVALPAPRALQRELAQTTYAIVVIGCTHNCRSRQMARRLARTAERRGSESVTVQAPADAPESSVPFLPRTPVPVRPT